MILSLICVPFSLGSICKYWIFVNEDTSSLKQVEQICQCALKKPGVFIALLLIHNQSKKHSAHYSWGILGSLSWRLVYRKVYRSALIPQNLTCPKKFLVARLLQSTLLKNEKNLKKDVSYLNIAFHSKKQKKNI